MRRGSPPTSSPDGGGAVGTGLAALGGRLSPDGGGAVGSGLAALGGRLSPDGGGGVRTGAQKRSLRSQVS